MDESIGLGKRSSFSTKRILPTKSLQMALRRGDHAGDAQAEGGGRGRRNTQWATAAAVKSVYRVDLKRADADLCLLGGDDEGGQGTATR